MKDIIGLFFGFLIGIASTMLVIINTTPDTITIYTDCDIIYADNSSLEITTETGDEYKCSSTEHFIKTIESLTAACVNEEYETVRMYLK